MKREGHSKSRSSVQPLRDKVIALSVFALAAALFYYLTHLPVAVDLKKFAAVEVRLGYELVMREPERSEQILAYQGGPGETVDVRFERAKLHADTIAALKALGFAAPTTAGEIAWITREGKGSQTFINIGFVPGRGSFAQLNVAPAGAAGHPTLKLHAQGAELRVEMGVPLGDSGVDLGSKKQLYLPGFSIPSLPGAFPVKAVVAERTSLGLQFGANHSASSFHMGGQELAPPNAPGVALKALGIREVQAAAPYDLWMCAARRGAVAWFSASIREGRCGAPEALIRLVGFELGADALKLEFAGSAFVIRDGAAITDDWYSKLENNKLISVLLGLFYAALGGWVYKTVLGSRK